MLDLASVPWPFVLDDWLDAIIAIITLTWQTRLVFGSFSFYVCLYVVLPFFLFSTYPS